MEEDNSRQEEARRVLETIRQKTQEVKEEEPALSPNVSQADPVPVAKPDAKPGAKSIPKPFSTVGSEDAAQLQALVTNSLGLKSQPIPEPEELAEAPTPEAVDPISTAQIKVMRKYAAKKADTAPPLTIIIYQSIIKAYFDVIDYFKPSTRALRCTVDGHQCLHCGQKFMDTPTPKSPKDKNDAPSPGEQNG